ncbi:MAG: hypothetical protein KDD75_20255, partial [Caldilineaceae bacterium]|nr:hypothetical protein [Caldilineaceae bacterium]
MVLFIMLMGPIGRLVWSEALSYPASSPLNLPPPWAPGYDQTGLKVVTQTESVSSAATATPAPAASDAQAEAPASGGTSMTGGNPLAKPTAASGGQSTSMTGGNPLAKPTAAGGQAASMTGGNPLAKPTTTAASQTQAAPTGP